VKTSTRSTGEQAGRRSDALPRRQAPPPMAQRPEAGDEENRLRPALRHLKAEAGVLERLVYKHRNQHRGAAYFQYLVKVSPGLPHPRRGIQVT
jgi:hypothetical protein